MSKPEQALNEAVEALNEANTIIDPIVQWVSPLGDVVVDRKSVILNIVKDGSWR